VNPLAIDPLSTFGMPLVDLVHLSADLGCEQVGMTMFSRGLWDPPLFPPFNLRDDPQLPAAIGVALRERGLTISFLDGFLIEPGKDIRRPAAASSGCWSTRCTTAARAPGRRTSPPSTRT
jgi:hypothetical protein